MMLHLDPRGALRGDDDTETLGLSSALVKKAQVAIAEVIEADEDVVGVALEVCKWESSLAPADRDALFLLALVVLVARDRGHTSIDLSNDAPFLDVLTPLTETAALGRVREMASVKRCKNVIGRPGAAAPLILDDGHLYIQKLWDFERRIAAKIRALAAKSRPATWSKDAASHMKDLIDLGSNGAQKRSLTPEQQAAALAAVTNGVTAITGGPGTGKTTVVLTILRLLRKLGVPASEVGLAAPTGRAGYRMHEALLQGKGAHDKLSDLEDPKTIHRLLSMNGPSGVFRHHEGSKLPYKWIIIDEGSMVEFDIMARLLDALDPEATLIVLGDADQLPAVGGGAVFRDLVQAKAAAVGPGFGVVRLEKNHRAVSTNPNGRNVALVARKVRDGQDDKLFTRTGPEDQVISLIPKLENLPLAMVNLCDSTKTPSVRTRFLRKWFDTIVAPAATGCSLVLKVTRSEVSESDRKALKAIFEAQGAARLLCLNNHGPNGVSETNRAMHLMVSRKLGAAAWLPGEPVMMTRNNPRLNIFNGDIGVLMRAEIDGSDARLMAVFLRTEGPLVASLEELGDDLVHAYATTVHKAQGGEHDHVGLLLPDEDGPVNGRELIYTAITRARESVTIIGSPDVLVAGVKKQTLRSTRLAERLGRKVP